MKTATTQIAGKHTDNAALGDRPKAAAIDILYSFRPGAGTLTVKHISADLDVTARFMEHSWGRSAQIWGGMNMPASTLWTSPKTVEVQCDGLDGRMAASDGQARSPARSAAGGPFSRCDAPRAEAAERTLTPLVELVALAARNGWEIGSNSDGELAVLRAVQPHRLRGDRDPSARPHGMARTATAAIATKPLRALRRWFTLPVRGLTDPTQW